MIVPVIVKAVRQADKVERLVRYCRRLDGTELVVLERVPGTDANYPVCNNNAFAHVSRNAFSGQPFFWMEPDSIPLQPGWLRSLTAEWEESQCEFLLSSDENPPYDMAGGIGIYGPKAGAIIPRDFTFGSWDAWLLENAKDMIERTESIQHSYGAYNQKGYPPEHAVAHRFPAQQSMIRPSAKIFHRDAFQDLIPRDDLTRPHFLHSGDLGDIIAALPILRALGGGDLTISQVELPIGKGSRESMRGARFEAIKPLLEIQPYVRSVRWDDAPRDITHDISAFRYLDHRKGESLIAWQARYMQVPVSTEPWLTVPAPKQRGLVIIARTHRYHNFFFPWDDLLHFYRDRDVVMVGSREEHQALELETRRRIHYYPTPTFLELAELIAGAHVFIGNQSAPFWVAAGLGTPMIQESWEPEPNSVVPRPNAWYTMSGPDTRTLMFRMPEINQMLLSPVPLV